MPSTQPKSEDVSGHYRSAMDVRTISRDDFAPGDEKIVTVARVAKDEVHDISLPSAEVQRREKAGEPTTVMKLSLHFRGTDRFLVLNSTNAQSMAKLFGADVDAWAGKRICLFRVETKFFGVPGAVRIKAAPQQTKPAETSAEPAAAP